MAWPPAALLQRPMTCPQALVWGCLALPQCTAQALETVEWQDDLAHWAAWRISFAAVMLQVQMNGLHTLHQLCQPACLLSQLALA